MHAENLLNATHLSYQYLIELIANFGSTTTTSESLFGSNKFNDGYVLLCRIPEYVPHFNFYVVRSRNECVSLKSKRISSASNSIWFDWLWLLSYFEVATLQMHWTFSIKILQRSTVAPANKYRCRLVRFSFSTKQIINKLFSSFVLLVTCSV